MRNPGSTHPFRPPLLFRLRSAACRRAAQHLEAVIAASSIVTLTPTSPAARGGAGAARLYVIEALSSAGATLLTVGIFFYTANHFGWGLRQNFQLAAAQGAIYVVGALLAGTITARVPHQAALALVYVALAGVSAVGVVAPGSPVAVTGVLLGYSFVSAIGWPILESLISIGGDARQMARRLATYNLVWPAVGAAAVAASGAVIEWWPRGMFVVAAVSHVATAILSVWRLGDGGRVQAAGETPPHAGPELTAHAGEPEPELLRVRTLALWVSRLALPATYAVIYGLMPMMPLLLSADRLGTSLDTRTQTLVSSTWLVTRWLTFAVLAMSSWWHTRPKLLLWAACLMLVAFLGITVPPSLLWGRSVAPSIDLAAMIAWQAVLGIALGVIYSGSLYFGMVLSEGSTEHGGYHEALIGLGWVLGPAAGAAALWLRPNDITLGVVAVGAVIAASVATVGVACVVLTRRARASG